MHQCTFRAPSELRYGPTDPADGPWVGAAQAFAQPVGAAEPVARNGAPAAATDFDFLHGQWLVENRRSSNPFAASSVWAAFDSVHDCRPLSGVAGHLEESASSDQDEGAAILRLFDARHRSWTIYRISSADGTLKAPLRGGFTDGVGIFIGEDIWCGRQVLVRETWTPLTEKPRWEQAFSADGGETWRNHWIRDFIRVDWPL